MNKTRDKLNEAMFFWNLMQKTQAGPEGWTQDGQDAFRYFHSAFLSAARSVTKLPDERDTKRKKYQEYDWYLEKEFGSDGRFNEWYKRKYEELQDDKLMRFFKDQRDITIHYSKHQTIAFHARVNANLSTRVKVAIDPKDTLAKESASPITTYEPKEVSFNRAWLYANLPPGFVPRVVPDNEVLMVSSKYLAKLIQLVDECESLFR